MRTPRKVKTTLVSGVLEVGGKFGGVFLQIFPEFCTFSGLIR
jgi:hypothetical protein